LTTRLHYAKMKPRKGNHMNYERAYTNIILRAKKRDEADAEDTYIENHPRHPVEAASKTQTGRTHSVETKAKLSKALSGSNHPNYGKKLSDEHKAKLSKAKTGANHPNAKTADVYCCKSGDLIASGVVLSVWAKENGYNWGHLSSTARADRGEPNTETNRHQHKGVYARYV